MNGLKPDKSRLLEAIEAGNRRREHLAEEKRRAAASAAAMAKALFEAKVDRCFDFLDRTGLLYDRVTASVSEAAATPCTNRFNIYQNHVDAGLDLQALAVAVSKFAGFRATYVEDEGPNDGGPRLDSVSVSWSLS